MPNLTIEIDTQTRPEIASNRNVGRGIPRLLWQKEKCQQSTAMNWNNKRWAVWVVLRFFSSCNRYIWETWAFFALMFVYRCGGKFCAAVRGEQFDGCVQFVWRDRVISMRFRRNILTEFIMTVIKVFFILSVCRRASEISRCQFALIQ